MIWFSQTIGLDKNENYAVKSSMNFNEVQLFKFAGLVKSVKWQLRKPHFLHKIDHFEIIWNDSKVR